MKLERRICRDNCAFLFVDLPTILLHSLLLIKEAELSLFIINGGE